MSSRLSSLRVSGGSGWCPTSSTTYSFSCAPGVVINFHVHPFISTSQQTRGVTKEEGYIFSAFCKSGGLQTLVHLIFLTHHGWNYWSHLVEEKWAVQKSQVGAQDMNPALSHIRAGATPTGQYRSILQIRNLKFSEMK